jgi:hypothetical protein
VDLFCIIFSTKCYWDVLIEKPESVRSLKAGGGGGVQVRH